MSTIPSLSEAQIRQHSSGDSYTRGESYYRNGAVGDLILRDARLSATVEGSQYTPYQITIGFDAGGVSFASCTCPYDWGGWCKHIIAVLLTVSKAPELIEERPPLATLLEGRDREQLATLIRDLAKASPAFAQAIEQRLIAPAAPQSAASAPRRTTPDIAAFQKQIESVFRPSGYGRRSSRYDYYEDGNDIANRMDIMLKQIDSFIDGGDATSALLMLEPLTDEFSLHWFEYDEEGELSDFFEILGETWALALLLSDLSLNERRPWLKKLKQWQQRADEYDMEGLNLSIVAAEQGWDDPQIVQVLQGKQQSLEQDPLEQMLLPIRLRVLQQQNRIDDYIKLARATGQHRDLAVVLARQGQHAEALKLARQHFSSADQALALAQAIREQGNFEGTLSIAEHGLTLAEPRAALANWLLDVAAGLGNMPLALHAGEVAMQSAPELALYKRLQSLDEAGWPNRREQLLTAMRQMPDSWQGANGRIDIFLHENLIDDAIQLVSQSSGWTNLGRVMDAAIPSRPEWVIREATKHAASIMNSGKAQHYDQAIEWLRRARAAYRAAGNMRGWETLVRELRNVHGRKYKLMGLLDLLERG